jgi:dipeptidase E
MGLLISRGNLLIQATPTMRLFLFSNSKNPNEDYLAHTIAPLKKALKRGMRVAFVPFAGTTISWDDYVARVREGLAPLKLEIESTHAATSASTLIRQADCVMIGGGNTFRLLYELRARKLLAPIRHAVRNNDAVFVGWSAGANVAGPTICTTNDMPIIDPQGLDALGFVPFQLNPHFTNAQPAGHQGETRVQRIEEYLILNPRKRVIGLPEGNWLEVNGEKVKRCGPHETAEFRGRLAR